MNMKMIIKMKMKMSQNNESKQKQKKIKEINDHLDEIINKSKSFEDQIKSIRKVENLDDFQKVNDFDDK